MPRESGRFTAHVRHLVVDILSSERLRRLGQDAERILDRIDSPVR
ncbi:hypothetical protein [Streptomyces sp. NPDC002276]